MFLPATHVVSKVDDTKVIYLQSVQCLSVLNGATQIILCKSFIAKAVLLLTKDESL
jgi:hypothetical protein